MNTKTIIAGSVAIALFAGIAVGWWWPHSSPPPTAPERKVLYWHDPMMPNQKFDKPGKSPFMDMQLVPIYEADDNQTGVRVSSNVTQSLGIRLGAVEKVKLQARLSAVGSVGFDEQRLELVQTRVGGYVAKLLVKATQTQVRQGQPLAEITAPEWLQAQEEYATLLANTSPSAVALRAAARNRLQLLDVPPEAIAHIERTHTVKAATAILAPIDGVVTELGVREGATFDSGTVLFRINGTATVWVDAQIPEAQLHAVGVGKKIAAQATAWPGESFVGRVQALLPQVDASSRTFTVRAVFANPKQKLSPGMFVTLELDDNATEWQLAVPSEAVIATGTRAVVIRAQDNGAFAAVDVVTGAQGEGKTVIASGLNEGDSIVVSGQFLIDSEASLKSTLDRLSDPRSDLAETQP